MRALCEACAVLRNVRKCRLSLEDNIQVSLEWKRHYFSIHGRGEKTFRYGDQLNCGFQEARRTQRYYNAKQLGMVNYNYSTFISYWELEVFQWAQSGKTCDMRFGCWRRRRGLRSSSC